MSNQSKDSSKSKKEADQKQPETVLLTAEELRTISGGGTIPQSKPIIQNPPIKTPTPH